MTHIWNVWWTQLGGHPGSFTDGPLVFRHPRSAREVLNTNFWYFPRIFEEGQLRNRGVGVWSSGTWERIASGEYGAIDVIGHIYDPVTKQPRVLGNNGTERTRARNAIVTLMGDIPQGWKDLLDNATVEELAEWSPRERQFQHCGLKRTTAAGAKEWIGLHQVFYRKAYEVLTAEKMRGHSLNARVAAIVGEMTRKLHRVVRASELWKAIRSYDRVPKANDLLYRLLLDVVSTGEALTWETLEAQTCPVDGEIQTIEHIWIDCTLAEAIWGSFTQIYERAARGRSHGTVPTNRRDLVGLFALGPGLTDKYDLMRWHILYSEAVWQIWKLYCNDQFRGERLGPLAAKGIYRKAVLHRMMMDRAMVLSPKHE